MFSVVEKCVAVMIPDVLILLSVPTPADMNERVPDPFVLKTCPELPSVPGNLKVLLAAKVSGVVNLTLLPFECRKLS